MRNSRNNVLGSLCKVSLQKCSQPIIFHPSYIQMLITLIRLSVNQLREIRKLMDHTHAATVCISKDRIEYLYKRVLRCLRIATNCLMFPPNRDKMFGGNPYQEFRAFLINCQDEGLKFLLEYLFPLKEQRPDDAKTPGDGTSKPKSRMDELHRYVKDIKSECKVALLLIEDQKQVSSIPLKMGDITITSEIIKVDFLMKTMFRGSDYLICKSLSCFKKMLDDSNLCNKKDSVKVYLCNTTEFLKKLADLLENPNSCIVRETCSVLSCLVSKPDGMTCWLKFDNSDNIGVDSSCVRHVRVYGKPQKIPKNTGYYQPMRRSSTVAGIAKGLTNKVAETDLGQAVGKFATRKEETKAAPDVTNDYVNEFLNWGVILNYGDLLEVMPPIKTCQVRRAATPTVDFGTEAGTRTETADAVEVTSLDWTAMCMVHFPLIETEDDHVLLESEDGATTHFFLTSDLARFCVRDGPGRVLRARIDTTRFDGWKHLTIKYSARRLTLFVDCVELEHQIKEPMQFTRPIRFIGK